MSVYLKLIYYYYFSSEQKTSSLSQVIGWVQDTRVQNIVYWHLSLVCLRKQRKTNQKKISWYFQGLQHCYAQILRPYITSQLCNVKNINQCLGSLESCLGSSKSCQQQNWLDKNYFWCPVQLYSFVADIVSML